MGESRSAASSQPRARVSSKAGARGFAIDTLAFSREAQVRRLPRRRTLTHNGALFLDRDRTWHLSNRDERVRLLDMWERPDYMPATWRRWDPVARRLASSPKRTIETYLVVGVAGVAALVWGVVVAYIPLIVVAGVLCVTVAIQARIYVPRALRAMRASRS